MAALTALVAGCGKGGGGSERAEPRERGGAARETVKEKIDLWTGRESRLRGANIHQARAVEDDTTLFDGSLLDHYRLANFDRLAELGANYVNISHPGLFFELPPYGLDPAMERNLDRLIGMIAKADMFAVISFRSGPGRSELTFWGLNEPEPYFTKEDPDESVWESQPVQDAWVEMWRHTAERFRDNPVVVGYDLMVEPNSNEVLDESDPADLWDQEVFEEKYGGTLADWNQLYPRIVEAIRQVDRETPILIGGNGYSGAAWLPLVEPVDDPGVVYTIHQYEPMDFTHQEAGGDVAWPGRQEADGEQVEYDKGYLEELLEPADEFASEHDVPVAANEIGAVRWAQGAAQFIDEELDLFEERGWSYALWQLYSDDFPGGDEFDFLLGPDPENDEEVETSDLLEVLREHWGGSSLRPSNVQFVAD